MDNDLVWWCYKIDEFCWQQSDTDFSSGNFVIGVTKSGKIKGTEKLVFVSP